MGVRRYVTLAGVGVLGLGLLVGIESQARDEAARSAAAAPQAEGRGGAGIDRQLSRLDLERLEQEIEAKLQGREKGLADREAAMGPQVRAKLQSEEAALHARASELSAQASKLATKIGAQEEGALDELSAQVEAKTADLEACANELSTQLVTQGPEIGFGPREGESGWLGIEIAEVTPEKAKELKLSTVRGVIVVGVEPDSPAAKAGLKANDVIAKYDRQEVEGTTQFRRLVRETPPGRAVALTVSRDGKAQDLSVEIGNHRAMAGRHVRMMAPEGMGRPDFNFHFEMPEVFDARTPKLGISAEDVSGQLGTYFGAPGGEGVLIREVRPGTPAEKAGLRAGDVITKVAGQEVRTVSELRDKLREKSQEKSVTLSVVRKGAEMSLSVAIEAPHPADLPHASHRVTL
jgi:serine protease Do